jgi:hypothetical protein
MGSSPLGHSVGSYAASGQRERAGDCRDQVDGQRDEEQLLAAELVGEIAEAQRPDADAGGDATLPWRVSQRTARCSRACERSTPTSIVPTGRTFVRRGTGQDGTTTEANLDAACSETPA